MILSISGELDKAETIAPDTFVGLNIWERQHIQEWVRNNPEILGEDLLIVTVEFDRFTNSSDRLDVLALDHDGNLVVVEFKRDSVSGYADLQAIRYAAMVSSMTIDKLTPYYVAYRIKYYNDQINEAEAKEEIVRFVGNDQLSNEPRIILCSEGFSLEITTTVLWLNSFEIDIRCITITPYKVGDRIVIVPKVVIPLEVAKQYLIDIKTKEDEREQSTRKKQPNALKVLIESRLVNQGDVIYLKRALPSYVLYDENDPTFQATITGKLGQSDGVIWKKDGQEYSVSALAWNIFNSFSPENEEPGSVNGNWHWVNSQGLSLGEMAADFLGKNTQ